MKYKTYGITMLEVMITSAILLIVLGVIVSITVGITRTISQEKASITIKQNTETALGVITADLKQSSQVPYFSGDAAVEAQLKIDLTNGTNKIYFKKYVLTGTGTREEQTIGYYVSTRKDSATGCYYLIRLNGVGLRSTITTVIANNLSSPNDVIFKFKPGSSEKLIEVTIKEVSQNAKVPPYELSGTVNIARTGIPTATKSAPLFNKDILKGGI